MRWSGALLGCWRVARGRKGIPTLILLLVGLMLCWSVNELAAEPAGYVAAVQLISSPEEFVVEQVQQVFVRVSNQGTLPWPAVSDDPAQPVRFSYHWIDAHGSTIEGLRTELPQPVAPGESLVLRASILSPPMPGRYTLACDLVRESVAWFAARGSLPLTLLNIEVRQAEMISWQRLRILWIAVGLPLLLGFMGFGIVGLCWPDFPKVLLPLVGIAVVTSFSYDASLIGIPMQQAKWGIMILGAMLVGLASYRQRRLKSHGRRGEMLALALTMAMYMLALYPLWQFGRPSSVQNTYASYFVIMSEYWQTHTLRNLPTLDLHQPLDYLVRERIQQGYIDGIPFLNAFVASTFGLDSYETYSILTAFVLALLPASLWWVARSAFGLGFGPAGLVAVLALSNATYVLWSLSGQLPFITGFLMLPLALGTTAVFFDGRGSLLLAALFLSTLLAVYPPLAAYVVAPLVCYAGLQLWRRGLSLKALMAGLLKLGMALACMNPVILYLLGTRSFRVASQISENWRNVPEYLSLPALLGLLPHFSQASMGWPLRVIVFAIAFGVVGIAGYGLYRQWQEKQSLLVATVLPFAVGGGVIALAMDYAYGFYKHGVVTLFVLLFAFGFGVEALWQKGWVWGRWSILLFVGAFFLMNLSTLTRLFSTSPQSFVSPALAGLKAMQGTQKGHDVVLLEETDIARQLWASYFLWGTPLSVLPAFEPWGWWGFSSVFGRGEPLRFFHPHAGWTLARWGEITRPRSEPRWANARYALYPGTPALFLEQGWHDLEEGAVAYRWMAGEGTLRPLGGDVAAKIFRLKMTLLPIVAPLRFDVSSAGNELGAFTAHTTSQPTLFLSAPFTITPGTTITIRSLEGCFQPARLVGGADGRCISARFQEMSLLEELDSGSER